MRPLSVGLLLVTVLALGCSGGPVGTPGPGQTLAPGVTASPTPAGGQPSSSLPSGGLPSGGLPSGAPTIAPTGPVDTGEPIGGWHLGGTVTGMQGSGLVLVALGEVLPIASDGPFQFPSPLPDGAIFAIRVVTQPKSPDQSCRIANGDGTIFGGDWLIVTVECTAVVPAVGLDPAFGAGGRVATVLAKGQGEAVAVLDDGKIVVAGRALGESSFDFAVLRYLADGSLDTTFGTGGVATVDVAAGGNDEAYAVAIQADGGIVLAGTARTNGATDDFALARFHADGTLDDAFGTGGVVVTDFMGGSDSAQAVAIQTDGLIVAAGNAANGQDNDFGVARYLANGTLDAAFGNGGKVNTNVAGQTDLGQAMDLTDDGLIVVAGRAAVDGGAPSDFGILRYLADGTPDPAFGNSGIVRTDIAAQSDDNPFAVVVSGTNIFVGGYSFGGATGSDFAVGKYGPDGEPDPAFGNGGFAFADFGAGEDYGYALAVADDGRVAIAGQAASATIADFAIARFTTTGELDTTFGASGVVTVDFYGSGDIAHAVAFVGTSVLAVGYTQNGSTTEVALVRTLP